MRRVQDLLARVQEQLAEAESGRVTPPAPSTIPMQEYYRVAQEEHDELMALQQEREERLQRAVGADAAASKKAGPPPMAGGLHGRLSTSLDRSGGGGGGGEQGSGLTSRSGERLHSASVSSRSHPLLQQSVNSTTSNLQKGGTAGGLASSLNPGSQQQQRHHHVLHIPLVVSRSVPSSPSLSPSAAAQQNTTDAASRRAHLVAVLAAQRTPLRPMQNPYRDAAIREAKSQQQLRPSTLALLQPTANLLEPRRSSSVLEAAKEILSQSQADAAFQFEQRHMAREAERLQEREQLYTWRKEEPDQLQWHANTLRSERLAARDRSDDANRPQRGIMIKVRLLQERGQLLLQKKEDERRRVLEVATESAMRVGRACLEDMESACRQQTEAAWYTVGQMLLQEFRDACRQTSSPAASPLRLEIEM